MREFRDQFPPGKQPRPVVTTPLIVYGKVTIRSGSDLVFDMTSSKLASDETNVKLTVLFDELLELNKRQFRDVLASSPLQSQYLDPNMCTARTYNERPRGVPWTEATKPGRPVFANVCTTQGQLACKCDVAVASDCACPKLPTQIAKPLVVDGDRYCDGSRLVPPGDPIAKPLTDVSNTLGLGSEGAQLVLSQRVLMFINRETLTAYSVEEMSFRWDLTKEELGAEQQLPRLLLKNVVLDGSGVAVDIEPQADSLYILLGEKGNCKYLHGIAAAGNGSMLASHRDSSALLHAASNGKRALPDFTLVTTHVGVIEVGGEDVGRVRIATVHWGHSSVLRPFIQQGVPSAADFDTDSD